VLPTTASLLTLLYLAVAAVGLIAGMGVNLLAERIAGDEEPPWSSHTCVNCRSSLPARMLTPVVGVWLLRRRCQGCGTRLTLRRPLLEGALALIFPLLLVHIASSGAPLRVAALVVFVIEALATAVLALIFVVDLEHHLVLDIVVYPAAVAIVGTAALLDRKALAAMLFGVVVCGGLFLLLYGAGWLFYRTEALGFGDVKLAVLLGLIVGWPGIIGSLTLCALFAAASTMVLLGLGRVSKHTYIAFGTFMSAGAVAALLVTTPYW
jgi:prepilin signal peptidase PulO-like enzyme (type II secretory pathway)